jgi:hypothetical protein
MRWRTSNSNHLIGQGRLWLTRGFCGKSSEANSVASATSPGHCSTSSIANRLRVAWDSVPSLIRPSALILRTMIRWAACRARMTAAAC